MPTINAYDTENYSNTLKVICDAYGNYYEPEGIPDALLEWLFNTACDLNFFYNIDYDIAILFHAIKPNIDPDNNGHYAYKKYEFNYIANKSLVIKKHISKTKTETVRLYDISQFYKTDKLYGLDKVAKEVLGVSKNNEELNISRKAIGETQGYYEDHKDDIIKYCIKDAYLTMLLAKEKITSLLPLLDNQIPKTLNSSASISKAYLAIKHTTLQNAYFRLLATLQDSDKVITAHKTIINTYYGGIFYLHSLGKLGITYEYDINSAYPYAITQLYSLEGAKLTFTDHYMQSDYSFWHVKIRNLSELPIHYRTGNTEITYVKSNDYVENWFTGAEIDYFKLAHSKDIDIQIIDGIVIDTTKQLEFPDYIDLYTTRNQIKQQAKDKKANGQSGLEEDMLQWNYKTVLNASYGVFAESQHGLTQLTNFVYASYITAITRLTIYKIIDRVGWKHIKAIMTDAVITDIEITGNDFNSNDLGKFKLEGKFDNVWLYMNGIYISQVGNKTTSHNRGFPSLIDINTLIGATGSKLQVSRDMKLVKIKEGIIQHKQQDIGKFTTQTKYLDLEANRWKYQLDVGKLTFEYLKDNELTTDYMFNTELQLDYVNKPYTKQLDLKALFKALQNRDVKPVKTYELQYTNWHYYWLKILASKDKRRDWKRIKQKYEKYLDVNLKLMQDIDKLQLF